ncbi:hypothetical protein [Microcystis aeruginosa]|nr:hypothetical protein [Microcystis aeruginosa]
MLPTSIGEGEKFSINTLVRTINSTKNPRREPSIWPQAIEIFWYL